MKEIYLPIFKFTLVIGIPDGTDGWLWQSFFDSSKSRISHTDLFALRIVKSRMGWMGIELVVLFLIVLLQWDN